MFTSGTITVTSQPEMRYLPDGRRVTNVRGSAGNSYTKADGTEVKNDHWVTLSVWGSNDTNADNDNATRANEFLTIGSRVTFYNAEIQVDPKTGRPGIYENKDGYAAVDYKYSVGNGWKNLVFQTNKEQTEALREKHAEKIAAATEGRVRVAPRVAPPEPAVDDEDIPF